MAVKLIETVTSRKFSDSATAASGTWTYLARATGEADPEAAVIAAVASDAPFFWYGMQRGKIDGEPQGNDLYAVSVEYGTETPNTAAQDPVSGGGAGTGPGGGDPSGTPAVASASDAPLGPNVSLEIGGRPPKLMQSRSVVYTERAGGGDAPDNMGALNVDEDGKVQGQEVEDPANVITIDMNFDFISVDYINLLTDAVWCTNLSDWYFMGASCVAFMGATLTGQENGRVKGAFKFGLRPYTLVATNQLRADAGKELPSADVVVSGWDYLEIDYGDEFDAPSGLRVKRPTAMRVHEVLRAIDFTTLGLGG